MARPLQTPLSLVECALYTARLGLFAYLAGFVCIKHIYIPGTSNGNFFLVVLVFVAFFAANRRNFPQRSVRSKTPAKTRQNTRKNPPNRRKKNANTTRKNKTTGKNKKQNDKKKVVKGTSRYVYIDMSRLPTLAS